MSELKLRDSNYEKWTTHVRTDEWKRYDGRLEFANPQRKWYYLAAGITSGIVLGTAGYYLLKWWNSRSPSEDRLEENPLE